MTDPRPLSDADLLAWSVVLAYRGLQQKRGMTILLLPFPPCPTCGGAVHGAATVWVERGIKQDATLTVQPCGHVHTATDDDLHRIHEHHGDLLEAVEQADHSRIPGDRAWTTDDIIRNARDWVGEPQTAPREPLDGPESDRGASGGELAVRGGGRAAQAASGGSGWTQLEARAVNAVGSAVRDVGQWLPLSARRAVANAVLTAVQPELEQLAALRAVKVSGTVPTRPSSGCSELPRAAHVQTPGRPRSAR